MARVVPSQVVEMIDELFPWAKAAQKEKPMQIHAEYTGTLSAISAMIGVISEDLLSLSLQDGARFNVALWTIRAQLAIWGTGNKSGALPTVKGDGRNPIGVLRELLATCPDEPVLPALKELRFIKDTALRDILVSDFHAVSRAYNNAEWKAATILAGSLVEALLLWSITERLTRNPSAFPAVLAAARLKGLKGKRKPPASPDEWHLDELIEVAREWDLISEDTATQARLAKDFRNLIHPGLAIRTAAVCNLGTASSARAAVAHTMVDLEKRFP